MSWEDNRYIVGNEGRKIGCKSNYVKWTEANQFWLPNFFVWDVIEMVRSKKIHRFSGTAKKV